MPHGWCMLWNTPLLTVEIASDLVIAFSYFAIPAVLFSIRGLLLNTVGYIIVMLFSLFILSCGMTHIMDIIVIWYPVYWSQAGIKLLTALFSLGTAAFILRMPRAVQ